MASGPSAHFKQQKYNSIRRDLLKREELFMDPEFPPSSKSLYFNGAADPGVVWKRPTVCLLPYDSFNFIRRLRTFFTRSLSTFFTGRLCTFLTFSFWCCNLCWISNIFNYRKTTKLMIHWPLTSVIVKLHYIQTSRVITWSVDWVEINYFSFWSSN